MDIDIDPRCCLDTEPFYQCCCQCVYRLTDYSHPLTNGKSILTPRGFICCMPPNNHAMSGWSEHGVGCEMFTQKGGILSVKKLEEKSW